jgi:hypothetical protein
MSEPADTKNPEPSGLYGWDFEGTRRHHMEVWMQMPPDERQRRLEEVMDELRRLHWLGQVSRMVEDPERS